MGMSGGARVLLFTHFHTNRDNTIMLSGSPL